MLMQLPPTLTSKKNPTKQFDEKTNVLRWWKIEQSYMISKKKISSHPSTHTVWFFYTFLELINRYIDKKISFRLL